MKRPPSRTRARTGCRRDNAAQARRRSARPPRWFTPRPVPSLRASEDHFDDELRADVGEDEREKARERPAHRDASAPSIDMTAAEQRGENEPRNDTEHDLVVEGRGLAEQFF